jgi:hypothetical protein
MTHRATVAAMATNPSTRVSRPRVAKSTITNAEIATI